MSYQSMFQLMLDTSAALAKDWQNFCGAFTKMGKTLRDMPEEGEGVAVMANALISGGVPDELIGLMTNEKLAQLADSVADTCTKHGGQTKYLFGMVNLRGSLDLYTFNPASGSTTSVTATLPDYSNEVAGQLMMSVFIEKNIERYAAQTGAVVFTEITNFMCGN